MTSKVLIAGLGGVGGVLARRLVARGTGVHLLGRNEAKVAALRVHSNFNGMWSADRMCVCVC
jgi:ketopantoate reductase